MNGAGDFFPVLGICLGFELLTYLASSNVEHRASCYSYNEALPLEFKRGKQESNSIWKFTLMVRHTLSSHPYGSEVLCVFIVISGMAVFALTILSRGSDYTRGLH
jgi:GMP synthase-like glutamine amidotransferase